MQKIIVASALALAVSAAWADQTVQADVVIVGAAVPVSQPPSPLPKPVQKTLFFLKRILLSAAIPSSPAVP